MHDDANGRVGRNISKLTKEKGLTFSELARRVGISQPAISMIARGKNCTNVARLANIAEVLGVSLTEIVGAYEPSESIITAICDGGGDKQSEVYDDEKEGRLNLRVSAVYYYTMQQVLKHGQMGTFDESTPVTVLATTLCMLSGTSAEDWEMLHVIRHDPLFAFLGRVICFDATGQISDSQISYMLTPLGHTFARCHIGEYRPHVADIFT